MSAVFMERMLARIREDCGEALRIFGTGEDDGLVRDGGAGASVVKRFVDRLVGEVVSRCRNVTCLQETYPETVALIDLGIRLVSTVIDSTPLTRLVPDGHGSYFRPGMASRRRGQGSRTACCFWRKGYRAAGPMGKPSRRGRRVGGGKGSVRQPGRKLRRVPS